MVNCVKLGAAWPASWIDGLACPARTRILSGTVCHVITETNELNRALRRLGVNIPIELEPLHNPVHCRQENMELSRKPRTFWYRLFLLRWLDYISKNTNPNPNPTNHRTYVHMLCISRKAVTRRKDGVHTQRKVKCTLDPLRILPIGPLPDWKPSRRGKEKENRSRWRTGTQVFVGHGSYVVG